jgi:hypothetical protein
MQLPGFTAESSLYGASGSYRLRDVHALRREDMGAAVQPAAVFRGCYALQYDCNLQGIYGEMQGWWRWHICDSRYCDRGFGLVTER